MNDDDRLDEIRTLQHRTVLRPVLDALNLAGFYAYSTIDQLSRWIVACDTELGRVDIGVGADGFHLEVWDISPGLFLEEEDPRRREALERLARVTIPAIERGYLGPAQEIWWDEEMHGVGARLRSELPFAAQGEIAKIARQRLDELNDLLSFVESRLVE